MAWSQIRLSLFAKEDRHFAPMSQQFRGGPELGDKVPRDSTAALTRSISGVNEDIGPNQQMLYPKHMSPLFQVPDLMAEGLVTIKEASEYLRLQRSTIYSIMERAELPYVKMGKSRRIPRRALRLYAEKG